MDAVNVIKTIEKHKAISRQFKAKEDEIIFDYLIDLVKSKDSRLLPEKKSNERSKGKYNEVDFQVIVSNENVDLSPYAIDSQILSNKDKIVDFWCSLNEVERNNFTIFELNIILYLISNHYNKYQKKDKKRIISTINTVVKAKRMENSYKNIVV